MALETTIPSPVARIGVPASFPVGVTA
jgi:hypothetical protein